MTADRSLFLRISILVRCHVSSLVLAFSFTLLTVLQIGVWVWLLWPAAGPHVRTLLHSSGQATLPPLPPLHDVISTVLKSMTLWRAVVALCASLLVVTPPLLLRAARAYSVAVLVFGSIQLLKYRLRFSPRDPDEEEELWDQLHATNARRVFVSRSSGNWDKREAERNTETDRAID